MASSEIAEITRGAGQQQRDARRDQRAEHEQQQRERHRHRRDLGLPEVLVDQRAGGPVQAGVARLGDGQPRIPCRGGGDRVQRRHHRLVAVVRVPRHAERHQGRVTAGQPRGSERRANIGRGGWQPGQRADDGLDGLAIFRSLPKVSAAERARMSTDS